eukprot:TRINITY_DN36035_c0_g1_i1.p1 TRINITY_DN36035_c0_g1~~TRINITY_DN36035_c0_g1_i1.p1  ORF type:complete len:474 (-),score=68.70 TRINITY_DN36035_c0_g1_i1:170-1591(-)
MARIRSVRPSSRDRSEAQSASATALGGPVECQPMRASREAPKVLPAYPATAKAQSASATALGGPVECQPMRASREAPKVVVDHVSTSRTSDRPPVQSSRETLQGGFRRAVTQRPPSNRSSAGKVATGSTPSPSEKSSRIVSKTATELPLTAVPSAGKCRRSRSETSKASVSTDRRVARNGVGPSGHASGIPSGGVASKRSSDSSQKKGDHGGSEANTPAQLSRSASGLSLQASAASACTVAANVTCKDDSSRQARLKVPKARKPARASAEVAESEASTAATTDNTDTTDVDTSISEGFETPDESRATSRSRKTRARPAASSGSEKLTTVTMEMLGFKPDPGDMFDRVQQSIEFMGRCGWETEDICCVLAHAPSYFSRAFSRRGRHMDGIEVANVFCLALFVSHSYVLDSTARLSTWQKHLFKDYCTVKELDVAILRILQLCKYELRVEDTVLEERNKLLLKAAKTWRHKRLVR